MPKPPQGGLKIASTSDTALSLSGQLTREAVPALLEAAAREMSSQPSLQLDLSQLESLDSSGAAALLYLWRQAKEKGGSLEIVGVSEGVRNQLSLFHVESKVGGSPVPPRKAPLLERMGGWGMAQFQGGFRLLVLAADTTVEAVLGILSPRRLRWPAFVEQMALIGSQAMGTVGLITFLVGLTLAFQSAHQLRQYGAAMWVADLTAVAMFREMGPLMTAILVAGRSGSAIAAEVSTMKVSEELDALQVMGIPFTRFMAVPRMLAMVTMMPLLVILADLVGILGGLFVGVLYLDLAPTPYLSATLDALGPKDLSMSLTKAVTFGWGIAIIALGRGLSVKGGAQEVGTATTSSVVQSLFFIILMDALFSILFYVIL